MKVNRCIVNERRLYAFRDIDEVVDTTSRGILVSLGAEGIALNDANFITICNNAICYADGEAAVLALSKAGFRDCKKIAGVDLWQHLISSGRYKRLAVIGGLEHVNLATVKKLEREYLESSVVYRCNGYSIDEEHLYSAIKTTKPDLVIVALGQPQQEILADKLSKIHDNALYVCVGGSLDVYCGEVRRAPSWMVKAKLEWLYRLIKQPKRLKRQMIIPRVILNILFTRSYVK